MSAVTVLIVDDAAHWRKFISFILALDRNVEIVCEAANAGQAVRAAEEYKPVVVLLDIGLPGVCGFEAGRQILRRFPETKIVFVTQESEIDVIHEAFSIGALGYVLKNDAGSELLMAIHCATRGQRYLSSSLLPSASVKN